MYIRVTRATTSQPLDDERVRQGGQRLTETFGQTPGYLGWAALVDRASGKYVSVTYWADAESMQASEEAGAALRARVASEGSQVIDVERYEFLIQERVESPRAGTSLRVTELAIAPERIDELISHMAQNSAPQVKAQTGFRSFLVSANRDTGKVLVASVWESAAAREASDVALRDERRTTTERFGATVVSIELYDSAAVEVKLPAPA